MPTINKRFLLKFLLVAAVLTGALFGAHAIQAGRIPEALRRQADRNAEAVAVAGFTGCEKNTSTPDGPWAIFSTTVE